MMYRDFERIRRHMMAASQAHRLMLEQMAPIAKLMETLNRLDMPGINEAIRMSRDIQSIVDATSRAYGPQLSQIMSTADIALKQAAASIAAANIASAGLFDSGVLAQIQKRLRYDKNTVDAYNAAGWPISPSMPRCLRDRVVELHNNGKASYVSNAITGYYRRKNHVHLAEAVESWRSNQLFAYRMQIFNDALEAHRQQKYTLSVPALIPQIEGVLSEFVLASGLPAKLGKINKVYEAAIGDPGAHGYGVWTIVTTLLHHFQTNTYAFTNFEQELEISDKRRQITRHTGAHGIALNYDKPIHSLRAFILLDALSVLETP